MSGRAARPAAALALALAAALAPPPGGAAAGPGPRPALAAPAPAAEAGGMLRVPGGRFRMGTVGGRAEPNESPLRQVELRPYWLDASEVSVEAYRACVERGACRRPAESSPACTYPKGAGDLPVNCVGFEDAERYCALQNKRLPTEAEWEFAARAGNHDASWPWGPAPPSCLRVTAALGDSMRDLCGREGPRPVGALKAGRTRLGFFDLAGNVEEWVADWYDDRYPATPEGAVDRDPKGPAAGVARVLRGGSWLSRWPALRVTARSWGSAAERGPTVGFRCARDDAP
ncbi:MAG TPA: SUMF1/EgtB/PvdO family nonheme iron enzyme [Polyangiaceae bacterium]|nr:SUMF1/EgtB/PvdO family nonheme iron enzyme [Polyangiaceae bacterium]